MNSELHIQTTRRENITYLKKGWCTQPFKIANIREDKRVKTLTLMLMTSSPGILDGDHQELKIEMEEGCALTLQTQSYQRLFDMQKGASQKLTVMMGDHCTFSYLPHPVVPHKNSIFRTVNKIYLAANCCLFWGEVLTCGRKLNGEEFLFSKYHSIIEIFVHMKLVVKENLLIRPYTDRIYATGQMEGYTHQASFLFLAETADKEKLIPLIIEYLSAEKGIASGISATPYPGLIVRLLGHKAEHLYSILKGTAEIIRNSQTG